MKMTIEGVFTTTSPMHISEPGKYRYDPNSGRFTRGGTAQPGTFPCTATRRQTMRFPFLAGEERNPAGVISLPVIPAQGMRGRLRRAASREIEDVLRFGRGEDIPFPLYQAMHSGAVSGNPDGDQPKLSVAKSRMENVFVGVFGGGTQMVPGRLRTGGGKLLCEPLIGIGAIPAAFRSDMTLPASGQALRQVFGYEPVIRKDDALQFVDPRAKDVILDYDDAMMRAMEDQASRQKQRVEAEESGSDDKRDRGLQSISYVQTVIAGTPFHVRLSIDGNEAQLGMLLTAFGRVLAEGSVGGKAAVGFGGVSWDMRVSVDGDPIPGDVFTTEEVDGSVVNTENPSLSPFLDAYHDAVSGLTVESLSEVMLTQPKKSTRKKKGGKQKGDGSEAAEAEATAEAEGA